MGSPDEDHQALGKREVIKFENMAKELTTTTKDKYYEDAYNEQVQNYKNF
jgi:hypothetical protein